MKLQIVLDFMEGCNVFVQSCFVLSSPKTKKTLTLAKVALDEEGENCVVISIDEDGNPSAVDHNTFTAYDKRREWDVAVCPMLMVEDELEG